MLSRDLEVTLNGAFKRARELRHEYMTVEHLLLGLLDNASAVQVLNACGAALTTSLIITCGTGKIQRCADNEVSVLRNNLESIFTPNQNLKFTN